ncbi:unnamed protein product, partial [Polarella glacialis]
MVWSASSRGLGHGHGKQSGHPKLRRDGSSQNRHSAVAFHASLDGDRNNLIYATNLIARLGQAGNWQQVLANLGRLWLRPASESKRGAADVVLCTTAIKACARSGKWMQCCSILNDMLKYGPEPNIITFNVAIGAHAADGPANLAVYLLEAMRVVAVQADAISYGAAIASCGRSGLWEQALMLLRCMRTKLLEASVVSFGASLSACAAAACWNSVLDLLAGLREHGIKPDPAACSSAVSSLVPSGRWDRALQLLRFFQDSGTSGEGIELSLVAGFNAGINACAKALRWDAALQLLSRMRSSRVFSDIISYNTALSACEKGRQWRTALQLFSEVDIQKLSAGLTTYNSMLSACDKSWQARPALQLFTQMKHLALEPDRATFNAVISACGSQAHSYWKVGLRLLQEMEHSSAIPGQRTCTETVRSCAASGHWKEALTLFASMRARQVEPDHLTWNSMLAACHEGADVEGANVCHLVVDILHALPGLDVEAFASAAGVLETHGESSSMPALLGQVPKRMLYLRAAFMVASSSNHASDISLPIAKGQPSSTECLLITGEELLSWHGAWGGDAIAAFQRQVVLPAVARLQKLVYGVRGFSRRAGFVFQDPVLQQVVSLGSAGTQLYLEQLELPSAVLGDLSSLPPAAVTGGRRLPAIAAAVCSVRSWSSKARTHARRDCHSAIRETARRQPEAQVLAAWVSQAFAPSRPDGPSSGGHPQGWSTSVGADTLIPVYSHHDRSGHAERQALHASLTTARLIADARKVGT